MKRLQSQRGMLLCEITVGMTVLAIVLLALVSLSLKDLEGFRHFRDKLRIFEQSSWQISDLGENCTRESSGQVRTLRCERLGSDGSRVTALFILR